MIVIDNFLTDKKTIEMLKNESTWKNFPRYNWWDGWWKIEPRNIMESLIENIWKKFSNVENRVAGFEYWSNLHTNKGELAWHVDKDEKLKRDQQKFLMPKFGHVYYVKVENLEGGYLEILQKGISNPTVTEKTERIEPVENRLVMFDPSKPHRVTKIFEGTRRAFLANAWTKKPLTFTTSENINLDGDLIDAVWKEKNIKTDVSF